MPYVVKWVPCGERNLREWPTTFPTPSGAVDFPCIVWSCGEPKDIWIEGHAVTTLRRCGYRAHTASDEGKDGLTREEAVTCH